MSCYVNVFKCIYVAKRKASRVMDIILPLRYDFSPMNLFSVIVTKSTMSMCIPMHVYTHASMDILASPEEDVWPPSLSFFIWFSWDRDSHWIWSLSFWLGYLSSEISGYSSLQRWGCRHQQMCLTLYMGATNLDSGSQASTTRVFIYWAVSPAQCLETFFS